MTRFDFDTLRHKMVPLPSFEFNGSWSRPHSGVAFKILRPCSECDVEGNSKKLSKEIDALRSLDNSNLLPSSLLDTQGIPAGTLALTSPWMEQGNILDYLRRNASADKFRMIHSVAHTLHYLHNNDVIHGDLKPENIFIDEFGSVVLANFGLSGIIDPCNSEKGLGSARYAAPELMDGSVKYRNYKSDVYALAGVSIEILTGVKPFAYTSSDVDVVMALYHNELPYSPPAQSLLGNCAVDETFWDLMKNCWNGNPDERPVMHHVCNVLAQVDSILQRDKNPGQHRSRM